MKKEQLAFLLLAIVTTISIMGIGISISLGSILVFSLSITSVAVCCGIGFTIRKRNSIKEP